MKEKDSARNHLKDSESIQEIEEVSLMKSKSDSLDKKLVNMVRNIQNYGDLFKIKPFAGNAE